MTPAPERVSVKRAARLLGQATSGPYAAKNVVLGNGVPLLLIHKRGHGGVHVAWLPGLEPQDRRNARLLWAAPDLAFTVLEQDRDRERALALAVRAEASLAAGDAAEAAALVRQLVAALAERVEDVCATT